jgi:hypothetical protein
MSNARMSNGSRFALATIIAFAAAAPLSALAQQPQKPQQVAPPKPYPAVAVTLPKPYADPGFAAFRQQLGAIAARKDRGALARLVANDFIWMVNENDKANKKKSGIDNLAAAIELDGTDGSGWEALAEAAKETTLEAIPDQQGLMCAPASPSYDEKAMENIAAATGTEPGDWGYPVKAGVEVRAAAQANAAVIDRLGVNMVWVLPDQPVGAGTSTQEAANYLRVVTPAGKTGFVAVDAIMPLERDQLCYRNGAGGWKIAAYAGGQ